MLNFIENYISAHLKLKPQIVAQPKFAIAQIQC